MNKKGSLALSITAIVVIVIAFVVLGLGLSLTKQIFGEAEDKLPEAFAVTQLEAEPTSDNPITIQDTIKIGRSSSETYEIGFYNKAIGSAYAKFQISDCLSGGGNKVELIEMPTIASIPQKVGASESTGFRLVMTENGFSPDTYICTVAVICDNTLATANGGDCSIPIYETKQFFLQVVA